MKTRAWVERPPLQRCPLAPCRRSGTCCHNTPTDPCRRTHQTRDAFYNAIAEKIERMTAEARRRDPVGKNFAAEGSPEFERRYTALYRAFRERDEASSAAKSEKPATAPSGG